MSNAATKMRWAMDTDTMQYLLGREGADSVIRLLSTRKSLPAL